MNSPSLRTFYKWILSLFLLTGYGSIYAQVDVGQPEEWTYASHSFNQSSKPILGNHPRISYLDVQNSLHRIAGFREQGLSIFLVLRPKFIQSSGAKFFSFKGVELSDSAITFRGAGKVFQPNFDIPLIISASFPVKESRGALLKSSLIDTSLYDVFEIIAYNRSFNREDIRKIEVYLSLKYSIPTTSSDIASFRNYPSDSANQFYWNKRGDRLYHQEVVALGNFPFSGLIQTQSLAYHEDSIVFSLDTIQELGSMPQKIAQEGSFIILSKRVNASNAYSCEFSLNQSFPITSWRLRAMNWAGNSDSLRIYYKAHQQAAFNDTIILTNGLDTINLRTAIQGPDFLVSVPLSSLKNQALYQFRVRSNACLDSSTLGVLGLDSNGVQVINLNNYDNSNKGSVEISSLVNDQDWKMDIPLGYSVIKVNREGQFEIKLLDGNGIVQDSYLIYGKHQPGDPIQIIPSEGNQKGKPALNWKLYPNPQVPFKEVLVEISELNTNEPVEIFVQDAQGRRIALHRGESLQTTYQWGFLPPISGFYTVTIKTDGHISSQKLLVLQTL